MGFNVLCIGDVVGRPGCLVLSEKLEELRERFALDCIIANVENAAGGSGLTPNLYAKIERYGVDLMTVCYDAREVKRLRAQPARTEVLRSELDTDGSRVEVRANNARRHQVRVHLASIGHPLLGDTLYGGPTLPDVDRHLLRASYLSFTDPQRLLSTTVTI